MTIQLSVLVWTVICFVVFMLLIDRLLFKPMLSFMDARQAKIDGAREKTEQDKQRREQALLDMEQARLDAEKRAHDEASAMLRDAKNKSAEKAEKDEQDYQVRLEQLKSSMLTEKQNVRQTLDKGMDELVSTFANKLTL